MTRPTRHRATTRRHDDAGMTLPELLIAITVIGLIGAVLTSAIVTIYRQADSTEGRLNVARAEQTIDTWLPADLSSTDVTRTDLPAVDTDPAATPCGSCGSLDLSGANALQLAWVSSTGTPAVDVVTRVQYQYIEVGSEWQLQRIECIGSSACTKAVVLHDLDPPADPASYDPNTTKPAWVLDVAAPEDPADLALSDNARRIVVTINGGGTSEGAGGGVNTVSLTAGGVVTGELDPDDFTVPSFVRAKSRCGGPVSLIVDDSGSITQSNVDNVVAPGVRAFIEAFRGTPTEIQVIQFSSDAQAIGPGSGWHRYVDMTDDAAVDALKQAVVDQLTASGGTNWEEAFFHTLKESDGTTADKLPNRIVFFTDGIPTRNRTSRNRTWNSTYSNGDKFIHYNAGSYNTGKWGVDDGTSFNQESFDRADVILDAHRGIDLIFVGVGEDLNDNVSWIHNPTVYDNVNADPAVAQNKQGKDVIAFLLANGPSGAVPATYVGGEYTNPETADLYIQQNFDASAFAAAMRAAALKDCGGTLTIQTRLSDGTNVTDEFVYENTAYRDDLGNEVEADARRVTTSSAFRTGTFDFEIPATVDFFSVDVVPQELQTLAGYQPVGWSCRAGSTPKTTTAIPLTDTTWEGFTVDVLANEAVSCVLTVVAS